METSWRRGLTHFPHPGGRGTTKSLHFRRPEVTAKIGEGGTGEVYRATDTKLKREVAVKVLPAALVQFTLVIEGANP